MSTFYAFLGELVLRKYMYKIIQIMLNHFFGIHGVFCWMTERHFSMMFWNKVDFSLNST